VDVEIENLVYGFCNLNALFATKDIRACLEFSMQLSSTLAKKTKGDDFRLILMKQFFEMN
jgi:hypothetical protein